MSYEMTSLSFKQTGISSSEQQVLTVLAFRCNDQNRCWPSAKSLTNDTKLNKKTVYACIQSLIDKGLVVKTGEMMGKTKSVPVYLLKLSVPKTGSAQNLSVPGFSRSVPKNGIAKHTQNRVIEYKDIIKKESVDSHSFLNTKPQPHFDQEYHDYVKQIENDKRLKLLPSDTIPMSYDDWITNH